MLDRLPEFIDPTSLADKKRVLSGTIEVDKFERLSTLLFDKRGNVRIELAFARKGRLATIHGAINGTLVLVCQRCLQGIAVRVDTQVKLGVIPSLDMIEQLAGEYEPLLFDNESISLSELVEDEILLVLPDFPRHTDDCLDLRNKQSSPPGKADDSARIDSPFSVLANLKITGDN